MDDADATFDDADATFLERARAAAERGEWQQAYELLKSADVSASVGGPDLALLADVAYSSGHLDVTINAWERAHAQSVRAGDRVAAANAALRVALHLLFDTALMAPVRGWVKRAERLLEGHDETPVYAWLAVVRSYERMLSGDFSSALEWARLAIEVGTRLEPAAAALGRVAEARSLILDGEVSQGLMLLNEAAVATVSGELDPFSTGVVYCEVVCALQGLAQYDLAEEWTEAMEQWRQGHPVGSIHGRCRVHRAEILRLRGASPQAEEEAMGAFEELRPYLRREIGWPLAELGRIRLHRGDIEGAEEAVRAAHEAGWDPQPGLAMIHLAKGDVALASASIRDALERPLDVPSKELPPNTGLRRAPLLDAQVEIAVAAADLEVARAAAGELSQIAALFESKALSATAALARGRVGLAEGDATRAHTDFEKAMHLWNEVGAPYETARARMGLAYAHRAKGNEALAVLEFQSARAGFERVDAVRLAAEAARACSDAGRDDPVARERQAQPGLVTGPLTTYENIFRREGDYWSVAFGGQLILLRNLKGLQYVARLLAEPGREFHALDLAASERGRSDDVGNSPERGLASTSGMDAGVLLDAQAKEAYRRRLAEIEEDIEEAEAMGDDERAVQAEAERDWLVRELARAVGLGGRDRRMGSVSERARASVTRAIRQALARIQKYHPVLGEHLDRAIRTGTYCAYLPDPRFPSVWKL